MTAACISTRLAGLDCFCPTVSAALLVMSADFGLSIDITQERPVTRVGTLDYMAPEVVICPDKCHPNDHKEKKNLHYTNLVDAWAVGVLAYELTVGRAPFDAGNKRGTIENILSSQPRFPTWISDAARHFVNFSLTKDTAKRPGIQQLAEHPWIHQYAGGARSTAINSLRAVSCHNLPMYTDPSKAAAAPQHRHKLMEQAVESQQDRLTDLQEDEDDVFVSASGEGQATAVDVPAAISTSTHPAVASEGVVLQQQAAMLAKPSAGSSSSPVRPAVVPQAATATASITVTTLPPAGVSPFAADAATPASTAASPNPLRGVPVLGAAANKLRAFVHSYRSASDLDSLKAFMLQQPPEPSNACFEPGGRFYAGSRVATAAGSGGAASDAAPKPAVHDSAASLGSISSSSSSCSRPADLPKAPTGANHSMAGFVSPKPLQIVKLPANLCQMPKSDSCKSLQGLTHIAEGKAEGKDSSMGGGPVPMSPGSKACSLAGNETNSPMPASPAAGEAQELRFKQHELAERERSMSTQDRADSASTSSCSCSSSCESGLHGSSGSVSSSHSWGYQQQGAEQYQAPQPPSPPCKLSRNTYYPFSPPATNTAQIHLSSGGGNQQQGSAVPAGLHSVLNPGASGGKDPSCQDFENFLSQCKPGHAVQITTSTGKRSLVSLAADCRGPEQQQQLIGAGEMLSQGPMEQANGCFGFLKSPRR